MTDERKRFFWESDRAKNVPIGTSSERREVLRIPFDSLKIRDKSRSSDSLTHVYRGRPKRLVQGPWILLEPPFLLKIFLILHTSSPCPVIPWTTCSEQIF
jgi:hypothetical protein